MAEGLGGDRGQRVGRATLQAADRRRADRQAEEALHHASDPPLAQATVAGEHGRDGLGPRPEADRSPGRRNAAGRDTAPRAFQPMPAMLDDMRPDDGDLDDLVDQRLGVVAFEGLAAATAAFGPGVDDLVGLEPDPFAPTMTGLPAPLAPDGPRGGAGLRWGGSPEGGREELAEDWLSRSSNSATRASRAAIRASAAAMTAATTA